MKTERVVSLKDFTIGLVLALAEKDILVIDKPKNVLHAAIESAYEAIKGDIVSEQRRAKFHNTPSEMTGDLFEPIEIIKYALGARLMTHDAQGQKLGIVRNECFTQAYFGLRPASGTLYEKAAQAFIDFEG